MAMSAPLGPPLRLPQPGMIRAAPLAALPDVMRELGADLAPIALDIGLSSRVFDDPEEPIAYQTLCALMAACCRVSGCPHLGLLVGQRSGLESMGALGYLMQNAPDVGAALDTLIGHMAVHDRGAAPGLEQHGDLAFLRYDIFRPDAEGSAPVSNAAMAIGHNALLRLCGPAWKPLEVHLRHAPPDNARPWRQLFQAPVVFNAERTALVFQARWLSAPVPGADAQLRRHFEAYVASLEQRLHGSWEDKVYPAIQRLVMDNRCSLQELARALAMHPRALERRLKDAGTRFRNLQNQARHALAQELLRDTDSDVGTIAAQAGYGSASAFVRAFSSLAGTPPAAWRKAARQMAAPRDPTSPRAASASR